jgi:hypothetical protein
VRDQPLHVTVRMGLAEGNAIADALDALAGMSGIRPGLGAEVRATVAARGPQGTDVTFALRPADAAVVRAIRAGLRRREAEQTAADIATFLGHRHATGPS